MNALNSRYAVALRALIASLLGGCAAAVGAVTLAGDAVPHLWHSFTTPSNAFLGVAGYSGAGWQNTDAGALYAEWGGFVSDSGARWTFSRPTVGASSGLTAVLKETSGTGIITGANNIYGLAFGQMPGLPLVFGLTLTDPGGAAYTSAQTRTVVMRSGTKGTLPDMNVLLNGVAPTASVATFRLDGVIEMPTGPNNTMENNVSSDAEWLWRWDNVPAVATYRLDFKAQMGHMSLDNLAIYASPPSVPPPPAPVPTQRAALVAVNALASQLAAAAAQLPVSVAAGAGGTRQRSR